MTIALILFATFMVGILAGYILLPFLVTQIEKRRRFGAYQAKLLTKQKKMEIRNSKAFRQRLKETLTMIKEEALAEKRDIKIAFHGQCRTDKELLEELNNLNFETYETGDRTLKISW